MDLKVVIVIVCLCALAITSTEAGIPKCCLTTKNYIPNRILRRVHRWEMQHSNGACDISALIMYVKDMRRPICAHPKFKKIVTMLLQLRKKRRSAN
ncbi:C-C motif chemokine 27a [Scomber japonicus]|uniref:C-C motif chemokine 27a n=1 Tax=Scomber japonicus TaxID=13676 RepID=UPI00230583E4|nr:C-C motif chemokine 27a [Scomber japonicus]